MPDSSAADTERVAASVAPLDLERELTCSICTDILHQPLTCLDCLHTFCGACLTEWFSWQYARAEATARHSPRRRVRIEYTCPSCRSQVRETRPNATVTTLLDMWMAANPGRGKSETEKAEDSKVYIPGMTKVFPNTVIERNGGRADTIAAEEAQERQLINQVREMSSREVQGNNSDSREHRSERGVQRRNGDDMPIAPVQLSDRGQEVRDTVHSEFSETSSRRRDIIPTRQIEHQSSLRSLLSTADNDSNEMQEEILRQIMEEGLLDGIDLDNLQVEQEDEISERIAQAYRRRQREMRSGRRRARSPLNSARSQSNEPNEAIHTPDRSRARLSTNTRSTPSVQTHHTQTGQALRSAVADHNFQSRGEGPPNEEASRRRSGEERRSTFPSSGPRISEQWRRGAAGVSPQPPAMSILDNEDHHGHDRNAPDPRQLDAPRSIAIAPSISCRRCGAHQIECLVHYNCPWCTSLVSSYDLCRRCYIEGKGCNHWFGFGHAAWQRYNRQAPEGGYPPGTEKPHILQPRQYVKTSASEVILQTGVFCDLCHGIANKCYWHCGYCNDGAWGFCNSCVWKGKHCTHPLLSLSLSKRASPQPSPQPGLSSLLATSQFDGLPDLNPISNLTSCNICGFLIPESDSHFHCPTCNDGDYDLCNQCYVGLISAGRISSADGPRGWRKCLSGHRMMVIGFTPDNHVQSLRRTVLSPVVGGWSLESKISGWQAAPGTNAVEGWTWLDSENGAQTRRGATAATTKTHEISPVAPSQRLELGVNASSSALSNGGYGTVSLALWTRVPDDGEASVDELSFPRNSEITEVQNINGDWCYGVYCRRGGLFPGPYVRTILP